MRFNSHNIASMLTSVQEDTVLHSILHDSIVNSREMNVTPTSMAKEQVGASLRPEGPGYLDTNFLEGGSKAGHSGTKAK